MALLTTPLASATSADIYVNQLQIVSEVHTTAAFELGTTGTVLAAGTPLGYDVVNDVYGEWVAPAPAQYDISVGTAGVFAVSVNGIGSGNIAYNATAVAITAAFKTIGFDVTATTDLATVSVVFDADAEITTVPTLVETTAPTATSSGVTAGTSTDGKHRLAAFVWPNDVTLDDTDTATGEIMVKGRVNKFSEILALVAGADAAAFTSECKNNTLAKDLVIRGIANINQ